jgi:hypothetical protein
MNGPNPLCVCLCVSVAILAQGTDYLLFFNGILVLVLGCNSVFAVGNHFLYLFIRYLSSLGDPVLSTHRDVYS